jgi:hypothetical protein
LEEDAMKKILLLAAIAAFGLTQSGCSSCRQAMGGWFNRGSSCGAPPADCPPGYRTQMMVPTSPQMLPGPIEIAPAN